MLVTQTQSKKELLQRQTYLWPSDHELMSECYYAVFYVPYNCTLNMKLSFITLREKYLHMHNFEQ